MFWACFRYGGSCAVDIRFAENPKGFNLTIIELEPMLSKSSYKKCALIKPFGFLRGNYSLFLSERVWFWVVDYNKSDKQKFVCALQFKRLKNMYFKRVIYVRDFRLSLREKSIEFSYGGPHKIKISLRNMTQEEIKRGHRTEDVVCTVSSEATPHEKNKQIFLNLSHRKILEMHPDIETLPDYIDKNGNLKEKHH